MKRSAILVAAVVAALLTIPPNAAARDAKMSRADKVIE